MGVCFNTVPISLSIAAFEQLVWCILKYLICLRSVPVVSYALEFDALHHKHVYIFSSDNSNVLKSRFRKANALKLDVLLKIKLNVRVLYFE